MTIPSEILPPRRIPRRDSRALSSVFVPLGGPRVESPVGAAQASSRDHRRFHNAALTRSAINESLETVGQKNTLLRGDHHGAQGGSKLRPTEENETAYAMMAEEYLDIVNLRWKSVTDFPSFSFFVIVMKLW